MKKASKKEQAEVERIYGDRVKTRGDVVSGEELRKKASAVLGKIYMKEKEKEK